MGVRHIAEGVWAGGGGSAIPYPEMKNSAKIANFEKKFMQILQKN